jgi:transposase-like protein
MSAAKRFFRKALGALSNVPPRVINVDKNPAYPAAVEALQTQGTLRHCCRLRQCKYLNNVVSKTIVPSSNELAGQGLRLVSKCLANPAGD